MRRKSLGGIVWATLPCPSPDISSCALGGLCLLSMSLTIIFYVMRIIINAFSLCDEHITHRKALGPRYAMGHTALPQPDIHSYALDHLRLHHIGLPIEYDVIGLKYDAVGVCYPSIAHRKALGSGCTMGHTTLPQRRYSFLCTRPFMAAFYGSTNCIG